MNQVSILLFFLSLLVLLLGLFKPNTVLPGKIAKTRAHVWLVYGSATTIFFVLFGMTLPAIQATTSQESALEVIGSKGVNQPMEVIKSDKLSEIVSNHNKYINYPVNVTSTVSTSVQVISNISKFQIWADPIQKKGTIIVVFNGTINATKGDTIRVIGTVGKKLSGQGPNGESIEAVCIIAQSVENVSH